MSDHCKVKVAFLYGLAQCGGAEVEPNPVKFALSNKIERRGEGRAKEWMLDPLDAVCSK